MEASAESSMSQSSHSLRQPQIILVKAGIGLGMVDYGIILGLLGVASGAASLIYSRSQVVAARRQAEQATRATLLESNREISVILQQIRAPFCKALGIGDELYS